MNLPYLIILQNILRFDLLAFYVLITITTIFEKSRFLHEFRNCDKIMSFAFRFLLLPGVSDDSVEFYKICKFYEKSKNFLDVA